MPVAKCTNNNDVMCILEADDKIEFQQKMPCYLVWSSILSTRITFRSSNSFYINWPTTIVYRPIIVHNWLPKSRSTIGSARSTTVWCWHATAHHRSHYGPPISTMLFKHTYWVKKTDLVPTTNNSSEYSRVHRRFHDGNDIIICVSRVCKGMPMYTVWKVQNLTYVEMSNKHNFGFMSP